MNTPASEERPTALSLGPKVGAWRLSHLYGHGTFGFVYRAFAEDGAHVGPVALKLAVHPADARFEREVELLSRIRHPSVPRLLDSGLWQSPMGETHPFVVMEWVEGEPLYAWSSRRNPTSRQVLALLAQAAEALQAIHEVSGVHRDVKGDNMLVRPSDGRLFLTDLGAGYFTGAARLTPAHVLPGTPEYRSPALWQYLQRDRQDRTTPLLARPEDDVFAMGVTAYRLVTDSYPRFIDPEVKQGWSWMPGGSGAVPPRQLIPRVDAQLNALILRMLSPRSEERGEAGDLAEAMKRGVAHGGPSADEPLFEWETFRPSQWTRDEQSDAKDLGHRPRHRSREKVLTTMQAEATERERAERKGAEASAPVAQAAQLVRPRRRSLWLLALLALGLWPGETGPLRTAAPRSMATHGLSEKERDPSSLAERALNAPAVVDEPPDEQGISKDLPEQPFSNQIKPDARGRCPKKQHIAINGGCWLKLDSDSEDCEDNGFVYQGGCYLPARTSRKVPTSAPKSGG